MAADTNQSTDAVPHRAVWACLCQTGLRCFWSVCLSQTVVVPALSSTFIQHGRLEMFHPSRVVRGMETMLVIIVWETGVNTERQPFTPMSSLKSPGSHPCFWSVGGSQRTWRELTQSQGELHTQKSQSASGFELIGQVRRHCNPPTSCHKFWIEFTCSYHRVHLYIHAGRWDIWTGGGGAKCSLSDLMFVVLLMIHSVMFWSFIFWFLMCEQGLFGPLGPLQSRRQLLCDQLL